MGDRTQNIARAIATLGAQGVRVTRESSLYETEPVDVRGGGWFLNCVVEAETELVPEELMQVLLSLNARWDGSDGQFQMVPKIRGRLIWIYCFSVRGWSARPSLRFRIREWRSGDSCLCRSRKLCQM